MSTPQWFAEFERQETMRQERIDIIRADMQRRDATDDDTDDLAPARGILNGLVFGVIGWICIGLMALMSVAAMQMVIQ